MTLDDFPRELLRAAMQLLRLESISLFVPGRTETRSVPFLLHEGFGPPAPELCDLDTAMKTHYETDQEQLTGGRKLESRHLGYSLYRLSPEDLRQVLADSTPDGVAWRRAEGSDRPGAPVWIGVRRAPASREAASVGDAFLFLAAIVAWHLARSSGFHNDPLTGISDRTEFQARLRQEFTVSGANGRPLSLALIKPKNFLEVNQQRGRELADEVLVEVAARLSDGVRSQDLAARFGSAIFAVLLPGADALAAASVARKLLAALAEGPYLAGSLDLVFSLGVATFEPSSALLRPTDLIIRADQALNMAELAEGSEGVEWEEGVRRTGMESPGPLSSIYTGEGPRDARNMLMLSELVKVISRYEDYDTLTRQVVLRLYSAMIPQRIGLFDWDEEDRPHLVIARGEKVHHQDARVFDQDELDEISKFFIEEARLDRGVVSETRIVTAPDGDELSLVAHAIPLLAVGRCVGCLYFEEHQVGPRLDSADLHLLRAVCAHFAIAIDRARYAEREKIRSEKELRRLENEVEDLRSAIQKSRIEYSSSAMEDVLDLLRRVAPTDVTVLVTGESGVGKGVIAKTLHELSQRSDKRLEVVDCASIPPTLIESELFGHEKGAFTGAQQKRQGRLREAHQGTLFLDEIGELPLSVQSKLLRFVQERTVTPVGSTRSYEVDVRVIAATNRDLLAEVEQGNFREDLFYRLNVIQVEVPPLRDRRDDIPGLVELFVNKYAVLYNRADKPIVTPGAMARLCEFDWPGNVRQLENKVQQAVVLGGERLVAADFGLAERASITLELSAGVAPRAHGSEPVTETETDRATSASPRLCALDELRMCLENLLEEGNFKSAPVPPLGTWLEHDLVLLAFEHCQQVAHRAAEKIGMPSTTYTRRLTKAQVAVDETAERSEGWDGVLDALGRLLDEESGETGRADSLQEVLLEVVHARYPKEVGIAASLVGVTRITYRRRLERFLSIAI